MQFDAIAIGEAGKPRNERVLQIVNFWLFK